MLVHYQLVELLNFVIVHQTKQNKNCETISTEESSNNKCCYFWRKKKITVVNSKWSMTFWNVLGYFHYIRCPKFFGKQPLTIFIYVLIRMTNSLTATDKWTLIMQMLSFSLHFISLHLPPDSLLLFHFCVALTIIQLKRKQTEQFYINFNWIELYENIKSRCNMIRNIVKCFNLFFRLHPAKITRKKKIENCVSFQSPSHCKLGLFGVR